MVYIPIYSADSLTLGTGVNVLITGWTKPERVISQLTQEDYAVIGPLYNKNYGLNTLLANLLANPAYNQLFLLSATKADQNAPAVEALYSFFQQGIIGEDKDNYLVPCSGSISKVFKLEQLESLRNRVVVSIYLNLEEYLQAIKGERARIKSVPKSVLPIIISLPEVENLTLPAANTAHTIKAQNICHAWVQLVHRIRTSGKLEGNRQELINVTSVISSEPNNLYIPSWLPVSREEVENYLPSVLTPNIDSNSTSYTYGSRLRNFESPYAFTEGLDQVHITVRKLLDKKSSTQCYLSIWNTHADISREQPPCLTSIWLRIVENKLILVANFRSHDIYTAYLSNLYALRKLQEQLVTYYNAATLDPIQGGDLICNSLSAHIYDWSFSDADNLIKDRYKPQTNFDDPVGNFVLELKLEKGYFELGGLTITQFTPEGLPVKKYLYALYPLNTLEIIREIIQTNPSIRADHAAYLALELAKVQKYAKLGDPYIQDID